MVDNETEVSDEVWKKFLRRHWKMTLMIIAGISVATIGGFLLFYFFILPNAIGTGIVPLALSAWTMGNVISFILNIILWEFLIIGIPAIAVAAVIFLQWWNKLPDEEKEEYQREPKKKGPRRRITAGSGSGIISFLVFLTWCIIIYIDGKWDVAFSNWDLNYLTNSILAAFLWDLLIFGLPIGLILLWWLRREMKESP
ncbi:MAG: hypothetical protein HWN65_13700 [Candidatus Helarchaeota archaeon]|nr:hypothetical protein [Candidatus Helarchaeota archaeon]